MNIKKSSLSKIMTLFGNDFKKYWVLAFVEFAIFFFSSSSNLLLAKEEALEDTAAAILSPGEFLSGFISMVFPILMAVSVFGYLHNVASVTLAHSLPISRKEHFTGHLISGYLLTVLPIILNGIILAGIMHFNNLHIVSKVIELVLMMMLMSLVTYSFSVLAGMLTGTGVMHVFGAITLNLFIPGLVLIADSDLNILLKGYSSPAWTEKAMELFLPITMVSHIKPLEIIWFVALSLILIVLSLVAYQKRKLENATDALVFSFTEPIIVGLLTFMFASAFGEYFVETYDNSKFLIGMAIGIVIGYILITMICEKTVRILNVRNIRNAAIFVCIMALFVGGAKFDITGYAKKVPEASEVKSITITTFESTGHTQGVEGNIQWAYDNTDTILENAETVNLIRTLHSKLVLAAESDWEEEYLSIGFEYNLKNGKRMERQYQIPFKSVKNIPEIQKFYASREFKEAYSFGEYATTKSNDIVSMEFNSIEEDIYVQVKDPGKVLAAMDKDFAKRTWKQENGDMIATISISLKGKGNLYNNFTILKTDANTIAELRKQGVKMK